MTAPFTLFTGNLNPSLNDLNKILKTLNSLFANVSAAGDSTISGNLSVGGTTALTGNSTVAGTLTVTGLSTLNGGIAGGAAADIAINTNKLTVQASTGNTAIGGTLSVTGLLTTSDHTARSTATTISAAGTTRADATQLTKDINNLTTVASGTGVVLSATGNEQIVLNDGANPVQVYGSGSDTIDGVAGSTGVVLTNGKRAVFIRVGANTIISAQLGVVSA